MNISKKGCCVQIEYNDLNMEVPIKSIIGIKLVNKKGVKLEITEPKFCFDLELKFDSIDDARLAWYQIMASCIDHH